MNTTTYVTPRVAPVSGIFRYAKRQGVINSENPMRDVVLPKGEPAGETYAYSLEEMWDAERSAGTSRDDRSCRGVYWRTERRTTWFALGELRRRAGAHLAIVLEKPSAGTQTDKSKLSVPVIATC